MVYVIQTYCLAQSSVNCGESIQLLTRGQFFTYTFNLRKNNHIHVPIPCAGIDEKIPFVKAAPIDEQETKKQKKHKEAQAKKDKADPEQ